MNQLKYNKKDLETPGCAYCGNSRHIIGSDMYIPQDEGICEDINCEYLEYFTELDAIILMKVLDRCYSP